MKCKINRVTIVIVELLGKDVVTTSGFRLVWGVRLITKR